MKRTIIYHRADYDGLFSGAVCALFLNNSENTFIGWDYHDPIPEIDDDVDEVYMVDISVKELMGHPKLIWIDHHKTAIDVYFKSIPGYRIDGVAACRLAYQYFTQPHDFLPDKEAFVERRVKEPEAIRLAGEYDVWDQRSDAPGLFQFGLYSNELRSFYQLINLFHDNTSVRGLVEEGRAVQKWQQAFAKGAAKEYAYLREIDGIKFAIISSVHARNSTWFPLDALPEGTEALMNWRYDGGPTVVFSCYHVPNKDLDLSLVAKKRGGGGHRGACGFHLAFEEAMELIK